MGQGKGTRASLGQERRKTERRTPPANPETSKWFNLPFCPFNWKLLSINVSIHNSVALQSCSQLTLSTPSPCAYARLASAEALADTGEAALKARLGVPAPCCCPADSL